jgi:hypothetical protein
MSDKVLRELIKHKGLRESWSQCILRLIGSEIIDAPAKKPARKYKKHTISEYPFNTMKIGDTVFFPWVRDRLGKIINKTTIRRSIWWAVHKRGLDLLRVDTWTGVKITRRAPAPVSSIPPVDNQSEI